MKFSNDGSFLEQFKKLQKRSKTAEAAVKKEPKVIPKPEPIGKVEARIQVSCHEGPDPNETSVTDNFVITSRFRHI